MSMHHEALLSCLQGVLVVEIPAHISSDEVMALSGTVLQHLEGGDVLGVVLNLRQLRVTETALLQTLDKMLSMIHMMGVPAAVAGMHPGLITALVHLDINTDRLTFSKNVQRAIRLLR